MAKSRLGRGLGSLIRVAEPEAKRDDMPKEGSQGGNAPLVSLEVATPPTSAVPQAVTVSLVKANPHQPRRTFNDASLAELAASIRSSGVIQPIVVRKVGEGYELIAGERRLRAAKLAGLADIPAIIRDVDTFTQAQMALVENIQREDLNPIDRALGYRTLIDQLGLTQAELAGRLGEDRSSVANFLRLLELSEPVRNLVKEGRLTTGHAKLLAGVSDPVEQERLAQLVVGQELSVRNLERLLQTGQVPAKRDLTSPSPHLNELEKALARQLGMRVQVKSGARKGKGRVVLHYASLDQFDDLLRRLGVEPPQD